jgi:hypothetical protein
MRSRRRRWLAAAATALTLGGVLLLAGCCCRQTIRLGPSHRFPAASAIVLPSPEGIPPDDTVSQATMRNVMLHLDDDVHLHVYRLQGRMHDLTHSGVIKLDDKTTLLLEISSARMGMTADDLSILLNRYVFGYRGSPLRDLRVRMVGSRMVQTGVIHNVVDLPFEMTAELSATATGLIRIHPVAMKICGVDGFGLMRMLNIQMEDIVDVSGARGVALAGNEMLLDPVALLPPPRLAGHLTAIRIEGDEMVQLFGGDPAPSAALPMAAENYVLFRGGNLRMGRLFMVRAELEAVDADPRDPFDFYLDHYRSHLVAGYQLSTRSDGMVAFMPDFADLGIGPRLRPALPEAPAADSMHADSVMSLLRRRS